MFGFEYAKDETLEKGLEQEYVSKQEAKPSYGKMQDQQNILRVYYNPEYDTYYVDVFVANSLGLISYEDACHLTDCGHKLYYLPRVLLLMYEKIYKIELFIIHASSKEKETDRKYEDDGLNTDDVEYPDSNVYKVISNNGITRSLCIREFNNFDRNKCRYITTNDNYIKHGDIKINNKKRK